MWSVTPSERKDSDSNDSRKTFLFLCFDCSVDSFGFFFTFSSPPPAPLFLPTSVVVVNFIGTIKSN